MSLTATSAPPSLPWASRANRKRLRRVIEFVMGPALLIALWWVAYAGTLVDPHLLPSPFATLADTWKNIASGAMTKDFLQTLLRVTYAFAIAAALGVPVGIVLGANESIYRSLEFVIDFFRSTPATAMFPLFLLLFGLGEFSKISVAAFAAWLVIVFNVAYGVMNARQTRILAARSMGAGTLRIFKDVIFFETLPQTFVGLRRFAPIQSSNAIWSRSPSSTAQPLVRYADAASAYPSLSSFCSTSGLQPAGLESR